MDELLNLNEAAKILSIKVSKLRSLVFKKQINFIKIGRLIRFTKKDLEIFVAQNTKPTRKY